jgi:hypothetical protein
MLLFGALIILLIIVNKNGNTAFNILFYLKIFFIMLIFNSLLIVFESFIFGRTSIALAGVIKKDVKFGSILLFVCILFLVLYVFTFKLIYLYLGAGLGVMSYPIILVKNRLITKQL